MKRIWVGLVGSFALAVQFPATVAAGIKERVVYSFCAEHACVDGSEPFSSLINVNGMLYGTTISGGTGGRGTVFSVDRNTGAQTVVYSFCSQQDCTDGATPYASLINVKGLLFGTTSAGGAYGGGTMFAVNPDTGLETVVHAFGNGADGAYPVAGLIDVKGTLYGTTVDGGANCGEYGGCGTVFSIDTASGAEAVLHSFCGQTNCTDGSFPQAELLHVNGILYGTTAGNCGELYGCGNVFSINLKTGAEKPVYTFCSRKYCADGSSPMAGLIDVNGSLYGTTFSGGSCRRGHRRPIACGTVFSLDPITGAESVVYDFCSVRRCRDGEEPTGGLVDVGGVLYGTTVSGGAHFGGTVFSLNSATGAETTLYSFRRRRGVWPEASLIDVKGTLYGVTSGGGGNSTNCYHNGCGTVFALSKP